MSRAGVEGFDSRGAIDILGHGDRLFTPDDNPVVRGYNRLAKEQQLRAAIAGEKEPGLSVLEIRRPDSDKPGFSADVMRVKLPFGYESRKDGQRKLFDVFIVIATNKDNHPIIKPGRLLCMKPGNCSQEGTVSNEDTIRFVKDPEAAICHLDSMMDSLSPEQRQLLIETFSTKCADPSEPPFTYEGLMSQAEEQGNF